MNIFCLGIFSKHVSSAKCSPTWTLSLHPHPPVQSQRFKASKLHLSMFAEELKTFRRLGFRHVRSFIIFKWNAVWSDTTLLIFWIVFENTAPTSSAQLCFGYCFRPDDVEIPGVIDQYWVSDRGRAEVWTTRSFVRAPSRMTFSVDQWSLLSTVEIFSSSQTPRTSDIAPAISPFTKFPEQKYPLYIV